MIRAAKALPKLLKSKFDPVLQEPIPPSWTELLARLDALEQTKRP